MYVAENAIVTKPLEMIANNVWAIPISARGKRVFTLPVTNDICHNHTGVSCARILLSTSIL